MPLNTDVVKNTNGIGVKFDTEDLKLKLELSKNFIKTGMVAKFNPQDSKFYLKTGLNLLNQKPDDDNNAQRVNQVSAALAGGYLLLDDLYAEIGLSNTKLKGKDSDQSETTKLGYIELAKRIKTDIGTIDTSINKGKSFYEFKDHEKSYGLALDYYPSVNTKLSASSQFEHDNNIETLGIKYKHWFANYQRNTSLNTDKIELGLSFAFDDSFDFSTYSSQQILPHLSELHRFEDVVLSHNMNIQSTQSTQSTSYIVSVITTGTGTIISGMDSDRVVADAATGLVIMTLSVNSPYRLSSTMLIFSSATSGIEIKTVSIIENGVRVATKSFQVTWQ